MDGACNNTDTGVAGADDICESRYAEDVASEHRTTIMEQHETEMLQHRALLASSGGDSNLPQNFDINGKDSLPIRRPDSDGTQIAASWAALFDGTQELDNSISGTEDHYWTGLAWDADGGGIFTLATVNIGTLSIPDIHLALCDDWKTNAGSVRPDPDQAHTLIRFLTTDFLERGRNRK